jgi:hypothetical protein
VLGEHSVCPLFYLRCTAQAWLCEL